VHIQYKMISPVILLGSPNGQRMMDVWC